MSILIGCLYVLEVVVCLMLVLVVMLQKPKEGGLNTALSGGMGEAVFGADAGNVLIRTTVVLGVIFLLNTLVLARLTSTVKSGSIVADEPEAAAQAVPAELPAALPAATEAPAAPQPAGK
jgi:preprotein translocase subunit SecG